MELAIEVLTHTANYLESKKAEIQNELNQGNFSALRYIDKHGTLGAYEDACNFVSNLLDQLKQEQAMQATEDWPNPTEVVEVTDEQVNPAPQVTEEQQQCN